MAEREIFFVRGKTVHKRRTKNGKPVIKKPTGKASHNDAQSHEAVPAPSFRAKREIFFIRGKTVYMRRTKNGKPSIRKTGKPLRHTNHNDTPHPLKAISKNMEKSS